MVADVLEAIGISPEIETHHTEEEDVRAELDALRGAFAYEALEEVAESLKPQHIPYEFSAELITRHPSQMVRGIKSELSETERVRMGITGYMPDERYLPLKGNDPLLGYRLLIHSRNIPSRRRFRVRSIPLLWGRTPNTEKATATIMHDVYTEEIKSEEENPETATQYDAVAIEAQILENGQVGIVVKPETVTIFHQNDIPQPLVAIKKVGAEEKLFTNKEWEDRDAFGNAVADAFKIITGK